MATQPACMATQRAYMATQPAGMATQPACTATQPVWHGYPACARGYTACAVATIAYLTAPACERTLISLGIGAREIPDSWRPTDGPTALESATDPSLRES